MLLFEEPKVEMVSIDMSNAMLTESVPCTEDMYSGQGGGSCIGNQDHSHGEGCSDTAPLIGG